MTNIRFLHFLNQLDLGNLVLPLSLDILNLVVLEILETLVRHLRLDNLECPNLDNPDNQNHLHLDTLDNLTLGNLYLLEVLENPENLVLPHRLGTLVHPDNHLDRLDRLDRLRLDNPDYHLDQLYLGILDNLNHLHPEILFARR